MSRVHWSPRVKGLRAARTRPSSIRKIERAGLCKPATAAQAARHVHPRRVRPAVKR